MKNILLATITAVILAACASNTAAPTQAGSLNTTADAALTQIKKREARTVGYYDTDGNLVEAPVAGGFYRNLLGYTQEGYAVVQDFYQDSQTKQINATIIRDPANLQNFNVDVTEGRTIWYSPKGVITQFADVSEGQVVRSGDYLNGRLASDYEVLVETNGGRMTWYYDNGKPMLISTQNSPAADTTFQYFSQDGKLILDTATSPMPQEGEANFAAIEGVIKQHELLVQQLENTVAE